MIYRLLDSLYLGVEALNVAVCIRMEMLTRATPERARIIFICLLRGEDRDRLDGCRGSASFLSIMHNRLDSHRLTVDVLFRGLFLFAAGYRLTAFQPGERRAV